MYLAHISEDRKREQSIPDHLTGTANLAADFSAKFGCRGWGYGCGMMHDIGKYSDKFQKRLLNNGPRTDHASAGAQELYKKKNYIGAYCISGHHSGLLDGGTAADAGGDATLNGRMQKELEAYQTYKEEIKIPEFPVIPLKPLGKGGFSLSFFIRMLFSCLVDADYLDTEAFMTEGMVIEDTYAKDADARGTFTKGTYPRGTFDTVDILFDRLFHHVESWLQNDDITTVNGRRTAILKACLERGNDEQGLYQLTVPTGGGKTLSSLAFALQHAKTHHLDRIIYVIPYTSIIEQNAQVFKDILGWDNVLEDHCNVTYEESEEYNKIQLAAENWDCPVVVTTNVQFFESLFANKTSKCRKLHNIANSVIIFDEAQMLPVNYLKPCIQAVSELVYSYHSTAVLCTATQPSLKPFFPQQIKISEICPDVEDQYEFFRRTVLKNIGELSENGLAEQLRGRKQVLCILNSRKRVQKVYEVLKEEEGTFHLSTFMYPLHRKRLLKIIRERLKEGKTCRLIATSLVEAGVDFDFPAVYRELAGLDSVIQAAGRCNREGKRPYVECETVIFTMEKAEGIHMPQTMKLPVTVAGQVSELYEDNASLKAIQTYFDRLYHFKGEGLDAKDIVGQMENGSRSLSFPFASAAKQFKLIEQDTKTILIAKEPEAEMIVERIRRGEYSRKLMREAGQYCVNLFKNDFDKLYGAGRLDAISLDFYVLRNVEQYSEEMGLEIQVDRGEAVIF
ncbi:CRISPR-associated helicase Cas3' [Clostridium sp. MCC353]|uniref:CRISPR-associated helicase Cas3' n=1 Tax=Clostridium sp. MCC353 TaxID=2592646 RepID=UPI00207AC7D4|nr:CRISPR-associated helicase Cas3' [Clostridium sp. MCC353]